MADAATSCQHCGTGLRHLAGGWWHVPSADPPICLRPEPEA